jgi:hypothetical protein
MYSMWCISSKRLTLQQVLIMAYMNVIEVRHRSGGQAAARPQPSFPEIGKPARTYHADYWGVE